MKRFLTLLGLLLCCIPALSGERGVLRWGLDWGYGLDVYKYWDINYIDNSSPYISPRVYDQDSDFCARPYAYVTASMGFEPFSWMAVSVFSGISGASEERSVIPLGVRASFFPRGNTSHGPLLLAGGGVAFGLGSGFNGTCFGLLGGGWRFSLNPDWNLDFYLRLRVLKDAPPIWDEQNRNYVEENLIRKNLTIRASLGLGMAISF
ncbi:MAG: hypothetical protein K6F58_04515 [Bacteroidales bacterium]|nr:hypothetical protein [Bacteroidales bacterium]